MYALEDFKEMIGVQKIDLYQGKGRPFARVGEHRLFVAEKIDWSKPLFVIEGKYEAWWICNAGAKLLKTV